jgi:hypothetical protein
MPITYITEQPICTFIGCVELLGAIQEGMLRSRPERRVEVIIRG